MASTTKTIKLTSSDDQSFEFKPEYLMRAQTDVERSGLLERRHLPRRGHPSAFCRTVEGDALETILNWLVEHEADKPRTEEQRQMHRFNRNVAKEGVNLLDTCVPRRKLAAVVKTAYYLEMPDLTDTLIKYTANNLEGKEAAEMAKWLEIPLKSDQKKKEAEDGGGVVG
ncbi:hypothetical protein L596_030085 [Steinernema carpocapsae]|uniref:Skp1-related protein n=1 Tax=Steinernema carpocapsae TaxID=34508 RepID=A0A4U5LRP9_STECR|nr:hypothetical protein L596_030085 [Steinernema carpocapsae]